MSWLKKTACDWLEEELVQSGELAALEGFVCCLATLGSYY